MIDVLKIHLSEEVKRSGFYRSQLAKIKNNPGGRSIRYLTEEETYGRHGPFAPLTLRHWPWRTSSSSGTSGVPLVFKQPMAALQREQAFLDFAWEKSGFNRRARLAILRGLKIAQPTQQIGSRMIVSMAGWSDVDITRKHAAFLDYSPEVIACYPSILERFLLACERLGLKQPSSVSLILAGSEACSPKQQALFSTLLGAKTVSWYGQSEQCALAFLQHDGVHEFVPGYSDLAFLKRGSMYEICGRSLLNPVFGGNKFYRTGDLCDKPFIRYSSFFETKVVATTQLLGRTSELITSSDGTQHPLNNIIFGLHGADWNGLDRYCVVHSHPGQFLFLYVPRNEEVAKRLLRALSTRIPEGFRFEARVCHSLLEIEPAKWRYLMRNHPPTATPED
ncbi:hypothetical protein [Glycocaulis sp.]|uniref:hypothetical protein n=1 Tax=Glycocaulis sp. TaxID=1969725 RepID=UPI003D19F039